MSVAVLHIICGNCGSNGDMKYKIDPGDEYCDREVFLTCGNCVTLHVLSDTVEKRREELENS